MQYVRILYHVLFPELDSRIHFKVVAWRQTWRIRSLALCRVNRAWEKLAMCLNLIEQQLEAHIDSLFTMETAPASLNMRILVDARHKHAYPVDTKVSKLTAS